MGERKDIDRLFQEKFKDFEKSPHPEMWGKIERELNTDKKKRRVIPLWWRLGGAAAILILFLALGFNWINKSSEVLLTNPVIVDTESTVGKDQLNVEELNLSNEGASEKVAESVTDSKVKDTTTKQRKGSEDGTNSFKATSTMADTSKPKTTLSHNHNNRYMAQRLVEQQQSLNSFGLKTQASSVGMIQTSLQADQNQLKSSNYDGPTIEEAIAEAEDLKINTTSAGDEARWSVSPTIAPVYSTAIGEGSTIHNQFNENTKSSDVTMSYGVNGSYAITKRLKVRAGVNRVDFSNSTNDVLAFNATDVVSQTQSSGIANISFNQEANLSLVSGSTVERSSAPEALNTMQRGDIVQDYGFIEVPLALEYRMVNQRFGINLIGGFSTFFLNTNQISIDINNTTTVIGEANNINNTSYSANFGIGFDYTISKNLNVMLEPTFKYQINTFSNTFGDIQPYFIGVYTGLNFKF